MLRLEYEFQTDGFKTVYTFILLHHLAWIERYNLTGDIWFNCPMLNIQIKLN